MFYKGAQYIYLNLFNNNRLDAIMKKIVLVFLFTLISDAVYATKAPLDYQQFGHLPMVTLAKVSPNGEHIVALLNNDDGPTVVVSEFGKKQLTTLIKFKKSQNRIDVIY